MTDQEKRLEFWQRLARGERITDMEWKTLYAEAFPKIEVSPADYDFLVNECGGTHLADVLTEKDVDSDI